MQGREKNISVKHFFVIKLSSGEFGKSSVFFFLGAISRRLYFGERSLIVRSSCIVRIVFV